MRYNFQLNSLGPSPKEVCFFCEEPLTNLKLQIIYAKPTSKNVLILDSECFEMLIALGIKVLWEIAPAKMETQ